MPFDPERVRAWPIPTVRRRLDERDVSLYALAVGAGMDPVDPAQLLHARPVEPVPLSSLPTVLAHPGFWMWDEGTGIDARRVVHGEQRMRIDGALPESGTEVVGRTRVVGTADKGPGRGALVFQERTLEDAVGRPWATLSMTTFCRGDGGCGGPADAPFEPLRPVPAGPPDDAVTLATSPQAALLFAQFGDLNALHTDAAAARAAGYERPILHGLATFGHACLAVSIVFQRRFGVTCRLAAMEARFAAPVVPGATLTTSCWFAGTRIAFETRRASDGGAVLAAGGAELELPP
jgi:acyl dehydratase